MKMLALALSFLVLAPQGALSTVETTFDKTTDFAALRTYRWITGIDAINPDARKMIVAAYDTEMAKLGFTKATTGGDVTLAYYTVTRTDIDPKDLDNVTRDVAPAKTVGRLVVIMRGGASGKQLWSASTREYVDPDLAKLDETIRNLTVRLFETYPTRKGAR
jgi:hypothetical protein